MFNCEPQGNVCGNTSYFVNIEFFVVGGSSIEMVDEWPQNGHIVSFRCDDKADI